MYRFSITVLLVWMAACLCLAHTTTRNEVARANVDRDLYKTIHGLWGGSIHYDCNNPSSMVSAQFNLSDLSSVELTFGTGFPSGYCISHGEVTHLSPDSLSILFSCDYGRPCFCSPGSPPVEICMKYSNPTAMSLTLAFVLSPPSKYTTCPPTTDFGCMENNTEVGVLELGCTSGACEVCTSSTCNNRGKCNDEGTCTCFSSFSGPTCNTSACGPNACNGHGICDISHTRTHYGVAIQDKSTEGRCKCFIGYYGPDCSSQEKFTKFKMTMWQALAFVCVVTSVSVLVIIIRKIKKASFRYRRFIRRRQREERRRSEVELETFVNPVL